jgi:hypothetical protein
MVVPNSTVHLQRARAIADSAAALAEYIRAIEAALEELRQAHEVRRMRRR